jgi:hypothetical protein
MSVTIKKFSGVLDTDTPNAEVNDNAHTDAMNVVFRGDGAIKRVQNIVGNDVRLNEFLPTTGLNFTIGAYYDNIRRRIFTFNYNSNRFHGIYYYEIDTDTWVTLLECGSGTDGDILDFNLDSYVHSINILYGGNTELDSDILFFVDSIKRPTQINIDNYTNAIYSLVKRSFIDVIKAPPSLVPQVTYENDTTTTSNNLKVGLYQFRTRFKYDNNEKSVYSAASIVPLPYNITNNPNNSDITANARIAVYVETGNETVKNIEIVGKETTFNSQTGWFLITSLNKEELGIADNSIYKFLFYNDGAYTLVDQEQTTELFDYVPDEANTQELLNGSVPIYGGIKEGYDLVNTNMNISVTGTVLKTYNYFNGVLFFAFQKSPTNIVLYLTGTGTNNGSNEPIILNNGNCNFRVEAVDGSYNDIGFRASAASSTPTISDLFSTLLFSAGISGWTFVSQTTNSLELSYATNVILSSAYTIDKLDGNINTLQDATFSLSESCNYDFGIQYFTSQGKTNGVMYKANYALRTQKSFTLPSIINIDIFHRPPLWASYYHIVRTDNQNYQKKTYWVSSDALSDDSSVSNFNNTRYAYINIDNMVDFSENLNTEGGNVSYEFTKGDRIRFLGVFSSSSSPNATIYTNYKDYEIIDFKINPIINGVRKVGNFIQIVYPTNDIVTGAGFADFKFDGSVGFTNYYILLYTPKKSISEENLPFFEFSKRFGIGNAGTVNAFHLGQEQVQSVNLVTPARIRFADGDLIYRQRTAPKNTQKTVENASYERPTRLMISNIFYWQLLINFTQTTPINVIGGILNNLSILPITGLAVGDFPTYSDTALYFNNTARTTTIRIKFSGTVSSNSGEGSFFKIKYKQLNITAPLAPVVIGDLINLPLKPEQRDLEFSVDTYITMGVNSKLYLFTHYDGLFSYTLSYNDFTVNVLEVAPLQIIENTWNDYNPIVVTNDGRPTVIDKDAKEQYNPSLLRWGLAYQQNTNINESNRFKAVNFDECDRSKGDILRFKARQKMLRVFQDRGVGQYGIYARFIQNNSGGIELVTTNDIITANNIQYYAGEFGLGGQPTSLVSSSMQDYFVDPIRGYQVRLSGDGLTPISEIYKGQYYIRGLLTKYNKDYLKPNGATAKILGYYDYFEEQYVCILEGGEGAEPTPPINNYTFAFNEKNNSYTSFFSFTPEMALCAEDIVYSWKNGEMWIHNNTSAYCNFYNEQFEASITKVFNQNLIEKKTFQSITEIANAVWECALIYTNMDSYGTQRQESELKEVDFATYESQYHAAFLRDVQSIGGLLNGNPLKGSLIVIKFQVNNASNFVFLSEISIKYISSQLTNR